MNKTEKRRETRVIHGGGSVDNGVAMVILDANPNINELDPQAVARDTAKTYACDSFFDESSTTQSVYASTAANLVPRLFEGKNGSAFCYGPTGTGKTFTMFGDDDHPGIVRLVGEDIFQTLSERNVDGARVKSRLRISGLEIYGETIRDLLQTSSPRNMGDALRITTNNKGKSIIQGLSAKNVESYEQYLELVELCRKNRVTEETNANAVSSRSHCIIQLVLQHHDEVSGKKLNSKLNLIDLAGSERATVTDENGRQRSRDVSREGTDMNWSRSAPRDPYRRSRSANSVNTLRKNRSASARRNSVNSLKAKSRLPGRSTSIERPHKMKSRLGECRDINSSLLSLKKVIRALVQKKKFIPWRNSKLTRLLEDTLQGDGAAYMIACISKGSAQWMATRDTLEYGTQARMIKVDRKSEKAAKKNSVRELKKSLAESNKRCEEIWKEKQELLQQIAALQKTLIWKDEQIFQLKQESAVRPQEDSDPKLLRNNSSNLSIESAPSLSFDSESERSLSGVPEFDVSVTSDPRFNTVPNKSQYSDTVFLIDHW